ncbi:MAG TPA: uroporphyrinogen-III C-methyltransferase, partial [Burkholderiaceae bacterium]
SVSFATAVTQSGDLNAGRRADTEVFYMAGARLGELSRRLQVAGWPADTPVHVVSRVLWPDQIASDHLLSELATAAVLHTGRPAIVTVGVGATPVASNPLQVERHQPPVPSREP